MTKTIPRRPGAPRPAPMTLVWTLAPTERGTTLTLDQTGHVRGAQFTPGAVTKRDYGTKTAPQGYAK